MRKPDIPLSALNEDGEQVRSFEFEGREYPDSTPMEVPIGATRPESLQDIMKRVMRTELSQMAADAGAETFEEAGDFDIEDDPLDPLTPWEALFDPVTPAAGVKEGGTPATEPAPASAPSQTASASSASVQSTASSAQTPIGGPGVAAGASPQSTGISGNVSQQTPSKASPA